MQAPQLYLVAVRELFEDDASWLQALEHVARAAATVRDVRLALQVRFEPRPQAEKLAWDALRRLRDTHPALPLWLNARAGVDPRGFDGVHLPENALASMPRNLPWAASVHSMEALRRARRAGAAFVLFGSIWTPRWKESRPQGIEALGQLTRKATLPVVAIGGVSVERVAPCLRAGAAGVAVASGIFTAEDVEEALTAYAKVFSVAA